MSLCLTWKFTTHNSSVWRSYTYQKIWKTFYCSLFFFSWYNLAIQNQNPGCHTQTSSFTDTHIPILSCILDAANQAWNADFDALNLFEEGNPVHSCPIASIPASLQRMCKSDAQKDTSAVYGLVRAFCNILAVRIFLSHISGLLLWEGQF